MSDLISRADIPYHKQLEPMGNGQYVDVEVAYKDDIEALPSIEAEDRHYIKIYADDEPSVKAEKLYQICGETQNREVAEWLKEYFPSAEPRVLSCDGCRHVGTYDTDFPCSGCIRREKDYYEQER